MKNLALTYLSTLLALGILDAAYLGTAGVKLFKQQLGPGVLRQKPVISAAVLFYLMYAAGLVYFVIVPNASNGFETAAIEGVLLGLFAYGTYDLTNMATLDKWTWLLVVCDMIWGAIVSGLAVAAGSYALARLV